MALEDVNPGTVYYWYYNAIGKLDKIVSETENDFGSGKNNTAYVMDKWTKSSWGTQKDRDMCGAIQAQVNQGWFVPSKSEWATFAGKLGITTSNYSSYGLENYYWSSSQYSTSGAYHAYFSKGNIDCFDIFGSYHVRLCATY